MKRLRLDIFNKDEIFPIKFPLNAFFNSLVMKLEVPSAFAKIFTAKNHRECFFVWNTDEYDSKNGKDPYTYKADCKDVFSKWGTVVGKAEGWTPDNKIALEALLEKYIVTESNKSKTGIASSLLNALRSE